MSDEELSRTQKDQQHEEVSSDDIEVSLQNGVDDLELYLQVRLRSIFEEYGFNADQLAVRFYFNREIQKGRIGIVYIFTNTENYEMYVEDLDNTNILIGHPIESNTWIKLSDRIEANMENLLDRKEIHRKKIDPRNALELIFPEDDGESMGIKLVVSDGERSELMRKGYERNSWPVSHSGTIEAELECQRVIELLQSLINYGHEVFIECHQDDLTDLEESAYCDSNTDTEFVGAPDNTSKTWHLTMYSKKKGKKEVEKKEVADYEGLDHEELHDVLHATLQKGLLDEPMNNVGLVDRPTAEYRDNIIATLYFEGKREDGAPDFIDLREVLSYIRDTLPGRTRLQIMLKNGDLNISEYGYNYKVQVFVHNDDGETIPQDDQGWATDTYEAENNASISYASHEKADRDFKEEHAIEELEPILLELQEQLDIPRSQLLLTASGPMRNGLKPQKLHGSNPQKLRGNNVKHIAMLEEYDGFFRKDDIDRLKNNLQVLLHRPDASNHLIVYVMINRNNEKPELHFTCGSAYVNSRHLGWEVDGKGRKVYDEDRERLHLDDDGNNVYNDVANRYLQTFEKLNAAGVRQISGADNKHFRLENSVIRANLNKEAAGISDISQLNMREVPSRLWTMPTGDGALSVEELLANCGLEIAEYDKQLTFTDEGHSNALVDTVIAANALTQEFEFVFIECAGVGQPIKLIPVTYKRHHI